MREIEGQVGGHIRVEPKLDLNHAEPFASKPLKLFKQTHMLTLSISDVLKAAASEKLRNLTSVPNRGLGTRLQYR
jgi:hypothetical protein